MTGPRAVRANCVSRLDSALSEVHARVEVRRGLAAEEHQVSRADLAEEEALPPGRPSPLDASRGIGGIASRASRRRRLSGVRPPCVRLVPGPCRSGCPRAIGGREWRTRRIGISGSSSMVGNSPDLPIPRQRGWRDCEQETRVGGASLGVIYRHKGGKNLQRSNRGLLSQSPFGVRRLAAAVSPRSGGGSPESRPPTGRSAPTPSGPRPAEGPLRWGGGSPDHQSGGASRPHSKGAIPTLECERGALASPKRDIRQSSWVQSPPEGADSRHEE